jgi:hypothetical protein
MAELINLQGADKHPDQCREQLEQLTKQLAHSRGKAWSREQTDHLYIIFTR